MFILLVVVFCPLLCWAGSDNCDNVEENINNCQAQYHPVDYGENNTAHWMQICATLECYLQCYKDAVGDCDVTDQYVAYDVTKEIVTKRLNCHDISITVSASSFCVDFNFTCVFSSGALQKQNDVFQQRIFEDWPAYKEAFCGYISAMYGCIGTQLDDSCTAELFNYYDGILRATTATANCGHTQDHAVFTTYGGPIMCNTSTLATTTSPETSAPPNTTTTASLTTSTNLETSAPPVTTLTASLTTAIQTSALTTSSASGMVKSGCSATNIASRLSKCATISLDVIINAAGTDLLKDFCNDLECNIYCYKNVVGECFQDDRFFIYDTELTKVTTRAYCNNKTATLTSLSNCQMTNPTCLSNFSNSLNNYVLPFFNSGNFLSYRLAYCGILTTFHSCIAFNVSGSCTTTLAQQATDFYVASTQYQACGTQDHAYFTTYGHDVTCGSTLCTYGKLVWTTLVAVLLNTHLEY